ncbi:MAG: penicillin-binding protein activator LpoB [Candidatus Omnitrophica bacterium CG08_land_8_20_14_0_20_41_16]|uniref:Penicillin-binding protein activator LpoB n=1 Tax=Candidatus Sherwoodlollariibacterium unditelluris TaxID=1974757 RepID=A0A2G9YJH6_9BACT|nr:MAG: penicillin-binding protein activator LpoB [Candidatus Omnitrophica bacterium CG23_combo_of_CG06-09_8_20_14_all_41_10]PIS34073.1 MAG: penicillin-binding protein activator LpoB [Candidatus Omnitrophica bacterium CG08_land_8_20_14_0_20_41_16]
MKNLIFICMFCLCLAGCATVETSYTKTVPLDEDDGLGGTGIEATDIRTVSRKMAESILNVPQIMNAQGSPKIALLPVKNSTRFIINKDIFTKKIRIQLNQNAQGKMVFLARDRIDDILKERKIKRPTESEEADNVSHSKLVDIMGIDFYLTGELMGLSKANQGDRSDYISMSFQLIDAETSEIIWENEYEVKRVGTSGVVYQ